MILVVPLRDQHDGRRAILTIDADGFFDRRFTRRPVAWDDLDPLAPSSSRTAWPMFQRAADPGNSTYAHRIYTRMGLPYLYVSYGALDHGGADILLAIDRYAPRLTSALT